MNIGSIVGAIFIISFFVLISVPLLTQVTNNQTVATYNSLNATNKILLQQQIYNPLNSTAFSSSGFGASIINTLGYAFIFPAIFQTMQALVRIPLVFIADMQIALAATGLPQLGAVPVAAALGMIAMYLGLYVLIQGVSSWQKYSLWGD